MSSLIEKKYYPLAIDPVGEVIEKFCSACTGKNCADCVYYHMVILRDKEEAMTRTGQVFLA
jgi:myosin-crossreactive antigen